MRKNAKADHALITSLKREVDDLTRNRIQDLHRRRSRSASEASSPASPTHRSRTNHRPLSPKQARRLMELSDAVHKNNTGQSTFGSPETQLSNDCVESPLLYSHNTSPDSRTFTSPYENVLKERRGSGKFLQQNEQPIDHILHHRRRKSRNSGEEQVRDERAYRDRRYRRSAVHQESSPPEVRFGNQPYTSRHSHKTADESVHTMHAATMALTRPSFRSSSSGSDSEDNVQAHTDILSRSQRRMKTESAGASTHYRESSKHHHQVRTTSRSSRFPSPQKLHRTSSSYRRHATTHNADVDDLQSRNTSHRNKSIPMSHHDTRHRKSHHRHSKRQSTVSPVPRQPYHKFYPLRSS